MTTRDLWPERPKTAVGYVKLAMEQNSFVVVAIPHGRLEIGQELEYFAQYFLDGHHLVVQSKTGRKDWDEQVKLFRVTGHNEHKRGEKFYRCKLVED